MNVIIAVALCVVVTAAAILAASLCGPDEHGPHIGHVLLIGGCK